MDFLMRQRRRFGGIWRYEPVDRRRLIHCLRVHRLQDLLAWEMQSEVVSDVLEMGYSRVRVRKAVEQRVREHGRGFTSRDELLHATMVLELLHAIMVLEEKEKRLKGMEMLSEALILRSLQSQRSLAWEMQSEVVSDPASQSAGLFQPGLQVPTYQASGPKHPQMADVQVRLSSFHPWPSPTPMAAQHLARAGCFYSTYEDNVKCFYCDRELRNWEPGDKPWTEHAKWCKFLLQQRGDEYVQGVQARFPKLQAQQQHMRPPDEAGTGHGKGGLPSQNSLDVQMQSQVVSGDATYRDNLEYVGETERIRMCKVWMKAKVHTAFIPCGHHNVSVCIYSSYCTLPHGLRTKCANDTLAGFSP